ncbi:helix-turn-helix transcriptional regulator [Aestuariicoccus sp. MJ-SS9]|uniref:helix-turn-helix transcriptional regulator n=1 Tax=Aestuariicoccus sp. MJ-SS9 TaxID=3079855 RepID=UPI0029082DD8|nr:helix-turn-helix transcriptional regulator [Aestuariicoccus sp. MJ-SS9]MDU8913875.1 helix-turn-helix transcriptional regulator [Aestuariicoccus sp. MJ-SS9]
MTEISTLRIDPSNLDEARNTVLSEMGVFGFDIGENTASEVTLKSCVFPNSQLTLHAYASTGHRFSIANLPFYSIDTLFEGHLRRSLNGDEIVVGADAVVLGHPGPMNIQLIENPESRLSQGISCFVSTDAAERLLAAHGLRLREVDGQIVTEESLAAARSMRSFLVYAHQEFFVRGVANLSPRRARLFESLLSDHIAELFSCSGYAEPVLKNVSHSFRLVQACEGIFEARFAEPISIADVAAELRVDTRTLQRAFKTYRGVSPSLFLSTLRLEAARTRLLMPIRGDTVSSVAHDCGFVHLGRFASRYRAVYGETPHETLSCRV